MTRWFIPGAAVAVTVLALLLAACGGGDGGSAGSATPGAGAATVSAEELGDAGLVLVDSTGQALYSADQEAGGRVLCTEGCTAFWEPLTIDGGSSPTADSVQGDLGVIERPDGARQVTFDGKLLYTFVQDQAGEVTGDGFEDAFDGQTLTWRVVHADGSTGSAGDGSTGSFDY